MTRTRRDLPSRSAARAGLPALLALVAVASAMGPGPARAEPYLAVENGLQCNACHVNRTGGGKRNVFGTLFARSQLSETILGSEDGAGWNGDIARWLGVGADLRGAYTDTDIRGQATESGFETTQGTAYVEARAIPGRLSFYFDRRFSPGGSTTREAFALLTLASGRYSVKAGQFFLPFGLRLHDDSAFVRQRSGINFNTPDDGIELGLELPSWSAQLAVTHGTAGSGSAPGKRQYSLSATHLRQRWRLGASYNLNEDPLGDRSMLAVFGGYKTGPVTWLAEVDLIRDDLPGGGDREIYASLLEANWRIRKAHNLKLSYDFVDPSDAATEDERERYSLLWEYTPVQLVQTRVGLRFYNGVPGDAPSNRDELFVELHIYL